MPYALPTMNTTLVETKVLFNLVFAIQIFFGLKEWIDEWVNKLSSHS